MYLYQGVKKNISDYFFLDSIQRLGMNQVISHSRKNEKFDQILYGLSNYLLKKKKKYTEYLKISCLLFRIFYELSIINTSDSIYHRNIRIIMNENNLPQIYYYSWMPLEWKIVMIIYITTFFGIISKNMIQYDNFCE